MVIFCFVLLIPVQPSITGRANKQSKSLQNLFFKVKTVAHNLLKFYLGILEEEKLEF